MQHDVDVMVLTGLANGMLRLHGGLNHARFGPEQLVDMRPLETRGKETVFYAIKSACIRDVLRCAPSQARLSSPWRQSFQPPSTEDGAAFHSTMIRPVAGSLAGIGSIMILLQACL